MEERENKRLVDRVILLSTAEQRSQLRGNGLVEDGFGNRPQLQFGHRPLVNNQG